ncbi:MAG: beta-N-acetylglucosaminidase domain-containing protein [Candidatus Coatesbacteria bacterium]|nr:beta-N-acetylglucosaminidase domain-containing protein [Candidatus Coatesbacteria bacterium]
MRSVIILLFLLFSSLFAGNSYFKIRGIVEGFYGPYYTHEQRREFIKFIGELGFNCYIYAPKSDPKHRKRWREGYSAEEMEEFEETIKLCRQLGIHFVIALSPGLNPGKGDIRTALLEKFLDFGSKGCKDFAIFYDDIKLKNPGRDAAEQKRTVNYLLSKLKENYSGCNLFFCPTVYAGVYGKKRAKARAYLHGLRGMDSRVISFWTGDNGSAFSPKITRHAAAQMKRILGCHIAIWDNYPVNDNARNYTYFGAYSGREKYLYRTVSGVFLNPMLDPNLSRFPVYTASLYFDNPLSYSSSDAYIKALEHFSEVEARKTFRLFADGLQYNRYVFINRKNNPELKELIENFVETPSSQKAVVLKEYFDLMEQAPEVFKSGIKDRLLYEGMIPLIKKTRNIGIAARIACNIIVKEGGGNDLEPEKARLQELLNAITAEKKVIYKDVFEPLWEAASISPSSDYVNDTSKTYKIDKDSPIPDPIEHLSED